MALKQIKIWLASAILLAAILVEQTTCQTCVPTSTTTSKPYAKRQVSNGKDSFYIGGIFGVHELSSDPRTCGEIRERGVQNLEAFMWALLTFRERFNNFNVLKDIQVGAVGFDTCSSGNVAVQTVLNVENCFVTYGSPTVLPANILAYVGADTSEENVLIASILGKMSKTQVSHAATSPTLSDTTRFPYFLRTVPTNVDEGAAMVGLLNRMQWKYVQLVYSANLYGSTSAESFEKTAKSRNICIVTKQAIPLDAEASSMDAIIKTLSDNKETRAVVIMANNQYSREVLLAARRANARGVFTFIGTSSWGDLTSVTAGVESIAEGAITITQDNTAQGLNDFSRYFETLHPDTNTHNPWFKQYWMDKFKCNLPGEPRKYSSACNTTKQTLRDVQMDPFVPYTIKAVDAITKGIDDARKERCPNSNNMCTNFVNSPGKYDLIHNKIRTVNLPGISFDLTTGDTATATFKIMNFRSSRSQENCPGGHCYIQIGKYNKKTDLTDWFGKIHTYDEVGAIQDPVPASVCKPPCLVCGGGPITTTPKPTTTTLATTTSQSPVSPTKSTNNQAIVRTGSWIIALIVLAGLGILVVLVFEFYLMSKLIGTPVVKEWRTMWLGQLLLFAIFLCYLTLFAFILVPTKATCGIIRFGIGGCYAMCFAILLVKLMIILSSKSIGYLKGIYQVLMFIFAWGVQLVVDTEWLILRPPEAVWMSTGEDAGEWVCNNTFESTITSLTYVMFLIMVTTLIAVKAHGIITNHREGIFIGLAAGFSIPIWLAWTLVGSLNQNRTFQEPCLAFGLLANATLILFVMFLPKVRQLTSMGVEGIYAEDDGKSVVGSVIYANGNPSRYGSRPGSVIVLNQNGGIYPEQQFLSNSSKNLLTTIPQDPNSLHLKHPGTALDMQSVRSAPVAIYSTLPNRPGPRSDIVHTNTKVLRVTGDLSGRGPTVEKRKAQSEFAFGAGSPAHAPLKYGTLNPNLRVRSFTDLGAL